jgi:hypothetical protein
MEGEGKHNGRGEAMVGEVEQNGRGGAMEGEGEENWGEGGGERWGMARQNSLITSTMQVAELAILKEGCWSLCSAYPLTK